MTAAKAPSRAAKAPSRAAAKSASRAAKPSREEKKAATREALIEAATRVFARQGYVAATVDEVAWEAGMTKGAVYSNFDSKDELFAAVIERHLDRRMLAIAESVDPTAPMSEQTALAGEQFMGNIDNDFGLLTLEYTIHAARFPAGHDVMRERFRRQKAAVGEMIERMASEAGFPPMVLPIRELVVAFFAMGDGIALNRLSDPEDVPDDLYGKMLEIFALGLRAYAEAEGLAPPP